MIEETILKISSPEKELVTKLQEEKLQLEIDKLQLETLELNKPWFKKIAVLPSFFTFLGVLITAIILGKNGAFDVQNKKMALEKLQLQEDIKHFALQKDSVKQETINFIKANNKINDSLKNISNKLEKEIFINKKSDSSNKALSLIVEKSVRPENLNKIKNILKDKDNDINQKDMLINVLQIQGEYLKSKNYELENVLDKERVLRMAMDSIIKFKEAEIKTYYFDRSNYKRVSPPEMSSP